MTDDEVTFLPAEDVRRWVAALDAKLAENPPAVESAVSTVHIREVRPPDPDRSRRGRSACRNGKQAERDIARAYGGIRVGHQGGKPDDLFVIQSKRVNPGPVAGRKRPASFPEWIWDELCVLPRTGGRIPTVVVSDKPGPGTRRRALVVRFLEDDVALHGPDASKEETEDAA
jgi:hypothetical protein